MTTRKELYERWEKEQNDFIETMGTKCWKCESKNIERIFNSKPYEEKGIEYYRVTKCLDCGSGYSNFTFKQWLKNKRRTSERIIKESKILIRERKEKYKKEKFFLEKRFKEDIAQLNLKRINARMEKINIKGVYQ